MAVSFARPDVSELSFHLFDRSVHPELFDVFAESKIEQRGYSALLRICRAGHTVTFCSHEHTITEVTSATHDPLPRRKRLLKKRLRGAGDESVGLNCGVCYHVSYQLEELEPEVFLNFHEELLIDCNHAAVAHCFSTTNRLSPSPLSLIRTDAWQNSLLIHAYHTFPENCAVVKTQSLFEA